MTRRLDRLHRKANYHDYCSLAKLRRMAISRDADSRLLAILVMQNQIYRRRLLKGYLDLAASLIPDADNTCRWQAMIVVGEYVKSQPERVWQIVEAYGAHRSADMRAAVATVLLEHLIDENPSCYRPRAETLAARSRVFSETLRTCWCEDEWPQRCIATLRWAKRLARQDSAHGRCRRHCSQRACSKA